MARDEAFTAFVRELLSPMGPVSARSMFGGVGLYQAGAMFGLIARGELYFKVGDTNRPDYEARGQGPFTYDTKEGRHTIGSFWSCPPELLDDSDELCLWARKSVAAALATAERKPKGRKRRSQQVR